MIDQGCAMGLAGTTKSSTAEAPIGAMSIGEAASVLRIWPAEQTCEQQPS